MAGPARTVVGKQSYDAVVIVQYPSPDVFAAFAQGAAREHPELVQARADGLEEQLLIPMPPGWLRLRVPAPATSSNEPIRPTPPCR